MKKLVTVERSFCDFCGGESSGYNQCLGCGKDICYSCQDIHATKYAHGVNVGGSGDGVYCKECDTELTQFCDPLLIAYKRVRSLRDEYVGWYEDFHQRSEAAESRIEELRTIAKATAKGK